jgi:hypothetical protein
MDRDTRRARYYAPSRMRLLGDLTRQENQSTFRSPSGNHREGFFIFSQPSRVVKI